MENTQFTPEVNLQPAVETASKPSRKLTWIVALVILALVAGAIYYFFPKDEETPPSLTTQRSTFQGLMQKELATQDKTYRFLSFDEADKALYKTNYEDKKAELSSKGLNLVTLKYTNTNDGMHYASFPIDMTFEKIVRAINPNKTEAIIVATWDPAKNNGNGIWVITDNTYFTQGVEVIKNEDLDKYTVPAGKAVIIGGTDDIEIWGAKDGKTKLGKNFPVCNQTSKGWHSYVLNVDKLSELKNELCFEGAKYIYVQKDEAQLTTSDEPKFELAYKAGVTATEDFENYELKNYIAWVKFDEAPVSIAEQSAGQLQEQDADKKASNADGKVLAEPQPEPEPKTDDSSAQRAVAADVSEAAAVQIMQETLGYDGTAGATYSTLDEAGQALVNDVIKDIQNEISTNGDVKPAADTCELLGYYLSNYIANVNSDPNNTDPHIEIAFDTKRASVTNSIVLKDAEGFTPISGPLNGAFDKAKGEYTSRTGYVGEDFIVFERESDYNALLYCLNVRAEEKKGGDDASTVVQESSGKEDTEQDKTESASEDDKGTTDGEKENDAGTAEQEEIQSTEPGWYFDPVISESYSDQEASEQQQSNGTDIEATEQEPQSVDTQWYFNPVMSGSEGNQEADEEQITPVALPAPTNLSATKMQLKSNDRWVIEVTWTAPETTASQLKSYKLTWCQKGGSGDCVNGTEGNMDLDHYGYRIADITDTNIVNSVKTWKITLTAKFDNNGTSVATTEYAGNIKLQKKPVK